MCIKLPHTLFLLFITSLLLSCASKTVPEQPDHSPEQILLESKKANEFFERSFNASVSRSPMKQTQLGIKTDYDKWDDISDAFKQKEIEVINHELEFLRDSIQFELLDESTKISYFLFELNSKNSINANKFRFYSYPVNQMHGWQSSIPEFLINYHKIENVHDARAYIKRIERLDQFMNQLVDELELREKRDVRLPVFLYDKVIEDCKNLLKGEPFDNSRHPSPIFEDFKNKVGELKDVTNMDKISLISSCSSALLTRFQPSYKQLIAYLEKQKSQANEEAGVWRFEKGEQFYEESLERTNTVKYTADQIHDIGLEEVERIHEEMKKIKEQVKFEGNLHSFFQFMRTDNRFYLPNNELGRKKYLDSARMVINRMKGRLDELFIVKPTADIIVKRVEEFREKSAGKAFYHRPAPDGSRPGAYYVNLFKMDAMPIYEIEALAYHEGIPGHHMQIAVAQELEGIPQFRKFGGYTAYVEGWALYCEFIPKEIGLYADPYSDFGRLTMELWRACRLVVDTGIHSKKWTRQEGIDYYKSNTPAAEHECINMVDRHIVMPSQATAYKIGMLKMMELRDKAKTQLGPNFDIREFHNVILLNGPLPLSVLEDIVNKWIGTKV